LRAASTQTLDGHFVRVSLELNGRARLAFVGKRLALFIEAFSMTVEAPTQTK